MNEPLSEPRWDIIDQIPDDMVITSGDPAQTDWTWARWREYLDHHYAKGHGFCKKCGGGGPCDLASFYEAVMMSVVRELDRMGALIPRPGQPLAKREKKGHMQCWRAANGLLWTPRRSAILSTASKCYVTEAAGVEYKLERYREPVHNGTRYRDRTFWYLYASDNTFDGQRCNRYLPLSVDQASELINIRITGKTKEASRDPR